MSTSCLPTLSLACPKISTSDASRQMLTLGNDIRYHNRFYYEKALPIISDAEYDRLFASLVRLEDCFPAQAAADSPTRRVGSAAAVGTHLVQHERPMLSLSSASGSDAVAILLRRVSAVGEVQLLVQPKVDGLPVELIYEVGRLVSASTRGDGRKRLQKLIEAGLINDLPSLFLLKSDEVADVPGFGAETAKRLTASIRAAGHADHFRLVSALGIAGVGTKTIQRLTRNFSSLDALLAAEQEQLTTLSGTDARALKIIGSFFNTPGGQELLLKFREQGIL